MSTRDAITLTGKPSRLSVALRDLKDTARNWRLWFFLGWGDVRKQYRRSFLGPIWITLSLCIFISAYGAVGSMVFGIEIATYIPYLTLGHVVFSLMNFLIIDSCQAYITSEQLLKQLPVPKLVPVLRVQVRNWIIFLHHLLIPCLVLLIFDVSVSSQALFSLFGLVIAAIWSLGAGTLLAIVCARFRDVPLVIVNLMQVLFFVTPVLWVDASLSGSARLLVDLNPIAAILKTVRDPLLGSVPDFGVWAYAIGCAFGALLIGLVAFVTFRKRIVYWL